MTPHDWKVIGSFGLLVGALALFDGRTALGVVGIASLVVAVRHADQISNLIGGS